MDLDEILLEAEEAMDKALDYLKGELRGVRTGRASTGLVDYIKVEYYGSPTDLRQLAIISVPEPTQLLIKPFDATSSGEIVKAIEKSGLGLNPVNEGKQIRLSLPALSGERRQQLVASVKQMGEQAKVTIRNARRDANKHIDQAGKDKSNPVPEDAVDATKDDVQELTKKYEGQVDQAVEAKVKEVQEI
ncbi:ribosome recycling factor [Phycisphaerales bacterium AB-hyl4]|uniref:Ribosome-recycling factor n=1 Tax=Natronomicrosphaera hydrolytica TaxID=3242702 RepID=A0ABV4U8H2_9BACT